MGGETVRCSAGAGEGRVDPATLMILRALAGERGKVEIGGRAYTFSCVATFHLEDQETGRVHRCRDAIGLLRTILDLLRDAREGQHRRHFASLAPPG